MGVLNVTPDSFSDGGQVRDVSSALERISEMVEEGADLVDVGGESTRPGSDPVTEKEELQRVIPLLEKAVPAFPGTMFSIDTTKHEVARQALACGVHMVNDVSGLQKEPRLAELCASYQAILVIMHSKGTPKTMQHDPDYSDAVSEIVTFLKAQAQTAEKSGVKQIVIDPGIGFGKTLQHNLEIIARLGDFCSPGYPVLVGASRKSMIGKLLADKSGDRPVNKRLAGTLALHYHALMQGAAILRVHDVREAKDTLEVFKAVSSFF
ncbi:MAG: dihydropteroate synthase [Balneolaceae bacterium]|nr:MAG: dihydropteroate synthase [Balneolaceae bacterium]